AAGGRPHRLALLAHGFLNLPNGILTLIVRPPDGGHRQEPEGGADGEKGAAESSPSGDRDDLHGRLQKSNADGKVGWGLQTPAHSSPRRDRMCREGVLMIRRSALIAVLAAFVLSLAPASVLAQAKKSPPPPPPASTKSADKKSTSKKADLLDLNSAT